MHASATIIPDENHVLQFPKGCEDNFWQLFAALHILLFLREGARIVAPLLFAYTIDCKYKYKMYVENGLKAFK